MADGGMCLRFQFDGTGFLCYVILIGDQLADEEKGSVYEVMKSANIPQVLIDQEMSLCINALPSL